MSANDFHFFFYHPSITRGSWFTVLCLKWCFQASNPDLLLHGIQISKSPIPRLSPALSSPHLKFLYFFKNGISLAPKWRKLHFCCSGKQWNSRTHHPFHHRYLTLLALKVLLEPSWFDRESFLHQWHSPCSDPKSCNSEWLGISLSILTQINVLTDFTPDIAINEFNSAIGWNKISSAKQVNPLQRNKSIRKRQPDFNGADLSPGISGPPPSLPWAKSLWQ